MGPDFLAIGTTRSGTTFLHRHLRSHPRVWLPPQKELHYLSYQRERGFGNRKHRKHLRHAAPRLMDALRGKRGPLAELSWQARYLLGPRNDRWFRSLYDVPGGWVCGQIEPTYAVVPAEVIRAASELLPETRLLFLMRDPIDRAWSSVTKSTAKNRNRPMAEVSEAEMWEKLRRSALRMSRYLEHIERWEAVFPRERFFFGFFEDIEQEPVVFLDRVCAFLGIEPFEGLRAEDLRPVNDTRRFKVAIPAHIERAIAAELLEPTRALERRFGGHTTAWRRRMERVLDEGGGLRVGAG